MVLKKRVNMGNTYPEYFICSHSINLCRQTQTIQMKMSTIYSQLALYNKCSPLTQRQAEEEEEEE